MNNPSIIDTSYLDQSYSKLQIFLGAAEVCFVAVLETLISARIADNLTGKFL
jgi:hypothetical protein